jgi:DNA-binding GntR family transcriptional regulator
MSRLISGEIADGLRNGSVIRNGVGDVVYAALLEAVHSGELAQGERVNDIAIAEELGISRTPVREALQRLKEIGVVESAPNRYTRIATVDGPTLRDALLVWEGLYRVLLAETMPLVKPSNAKAMRRISSRFATAVEHVDSKAAARANFDFYDHLVALSTNRFLRHALESVVHVVRLGGVSLPSWLDTDQLRSAQLDLVTALEDKNMDAAVEAAHCAVLTGLRPREATTA